MAWIELHQTLPANKKTIRLKKLLHIKTPQAVGHLCILWLWALDNSPDGDMSAFSADEIAEVAQWAGKSADDFLAALIQSGFIDEDMHIHDWYAYAGKLIDKRKGNAERMRSARAANVQRTCDARAGATVPYPTVPNHTIEDTPPIPPEGEGKKTPAKKLTKAQERECLDEAALLPGVREALERWLAYKRERGDGYKPTGINGLIKTAGDKAAQCGAEAVCRVIDESIASNYMGIAWDRARPQVQPAGQNRYSNLQRQYEAALREEAMKDDET